MPRPRDIFEIAKYNNCSEYARITARSSERTLEEFLHVDAGCAGGKDDCGRDAYSFYGISSCRCHVERTEWEMKGWMMGVSPRSRECERPSDLPLQSGYVSCARSQVFLSALVRFEPRDGVSRHR